MCVLPILVGLKGQFSDPVEDLLLRRGSRRVAGFHHVCLCLDGFCDLRGRAWAVENCNDDDKSNRVCRNELRILSIRGYPTEPVWSCNCHGGLRCLFSVQLELYSLGNGDGVESSIRLGKRW